MRYVIHMNVRNLYYTRELVTYIEWPFNMLSMTVMYQDMMHLFIYLFIILFIYLSTHCIIYSLIYLLFF